MSSWSRRDVAVTGWLRRWRQQAMPALRKSGARGPVARLDSKRRTATPQERLNRSARIGGKTNERIGWRLGSPAHHRALKVPEAAQGRSARSRQGLSGRKRTEPFSNAPPATPALGFLEAGSVTQASTTSRWRAIYPTLDSWRRLAGGRLTRLVP